MTPERWEQVARVYQLALEQAPLAREGFLAEACGDDADLRREVESLLGHEGGVDTVLERPAVAIAAPMLNNSTSSSALTGRQIGPYQIGALLGAGGMGEVYRARDTSLNRDVAWKVLPESFATDAERVARFQREAEVLASLNHPNIAAIYGLQDADRLKALVMELVEGEELAERIARGPVPVDEALPIAKQICEALEAAHKQGIIHRDLKPANIKIRPDGTVKVLDFGLAKALEPASHSDGGALAISPAVMTQAGMLLGTAAYMAPEQAKGRPADRRSDIWAFGCVLYEMLTGRRAFDGEDVTDTIVAVMNKQPDWAALPAALPPPLATIARRCLEKDPWKRLPHMAIIRFAIEEAQASSVALAPPVPGPPRRMTLTRVLSVSAAVALILSTGLILGRWWTGRRVAPVSSPPVRATVLVPQNLDPRAPSHRFAVSPDGRRFAYLAADNRFSPVRLWIRPLDNLTAQPLAGTEGADFPFWSPDSRSVAFFADGQLKKVDVRGGPPVKIADAPVRSDGDSKPLSGIGQFTGTWNQHDVIVFARDNTLWKVSARGGTPQMITTTDPGGKETHFAFPHFLPDGNHFLYVTYTGIDPVATYVASLDRADRVRVMEGGSNVQYAAGALLFLRGTSLIAQPFDASRGVLSGDAVPLADSMQSNYSVFQGGGAFSVSKTGVLVYQQSFALLGSRLVWSTRAGQQTVILNGPLPLLLLDLSLASDGNRAAVSLRDGRGGSDIWLVNLGRAMLTKLTLSGLADRVVWSPGNREVVFRRRRGTISDLYRKSVEGAGEEQLLFAENRENRPIGPFAGDPLSWSPDGRVALYVRQQDIWAVTLDGSKTFAVVTAPSRERWPQFSRDGQWIAYASDASRRQEVYVTSSTGVGRWQISRDGGNYPRWSPDRRELFFHSPDNRILAAQIDTRTGRPEVKSLTPLFTARALPGAERFFYDVAPDGRFLLAVAASETTEAQLTLVLNWPELIRARTP
jgi:serine/threonine protein kinase/Tol biopolymer transport system component